MVVITNELKINEIETMAEECGMLTEFKEEDYDMVHYYNYLSSNNNNNPQSQILLAVMKKR